VWADFSECKAEFLISGKGGKREKRRKEKEEKKKGESSNFNNNFSKQYNFCSIMPYIHAQPLPSEKMHNNKMK
jgi:hypothetical protein